MIRIFKYIVFLILIFNNISVNASNVKLNLEDENNPNYISADFKGALNLPHPIVFKQILDKNDNTSSGRLLLIGFYFDKKYPDNAIEYDFSDDVSIIFPELNQSELIDKTKLIRLLVKTYRWGKVKYNEIASDMLIPQEPPLLVDEDEYALLNTVDYIPVPDNSYAIINDFKKVVSYSNNPKDVKSMEAYQQKLLEQKENKTDYEKFSSMLSKIEFSKIPSYGITLPNPFVGNAGIGKWITINNGYKIRSISELAKIYNTDEFIVGLHVSVPNHRLMLANNLSEKLQKPKIELTDTKNIKSYQVLYPLPIPFLDQNMINVYSSDFMFPIIIKTNNSDQPVSYKAEITFQDCDVRLDCKKQIAYAPILIEKGNDNFSSSIKNFVRQSYYNIPKNKNEKLRISNIDTVFDENNNVKKINMVVSYKGDVKNFNVLLEDKSITSFSAPIVKINDEKIFISIDVLSNQDIIFNNPIDISIRLNTSENLRQTITLADYKAETQFYDSVLKTIFLLFLAGLLFNLTPVGIMVFSIMANMQTFKNNYHYLIYYCIGMFVSFSLLFLFTIIYSQHIHWGCQFTNMFYLGLCSLVTLIIAISTKYKQEILSFNHKFKSIILSLLPSVLFPISYSPYSETIYFKVLSNNIKSYYLVIFVLGILLPYIVYNMWNKKQLSQKTHTWLNTTTRYAALISFFYIIILIFMQAESFSFIILAIMLIAYATYKFFFNFIEALYQTDLSPEKKHISETILIIIFVLLTILYSKIIMNYINVKTYQPSMDNIKKQVDNLIHQNKPVLVALDADWSFIGKLNNFTSLSKYNMKRMQKFHNLEYIHVNISTITPDIAKYLSSNNQYDLPLYILYTINTNDGVVLPKLLTDTDLEQALRNFQP